MSQIFTIPLENLQEEMETILSKKDGEEYVQELLDEANRLFALHYPHIDTFWEGYERIMDAGGYRLVPDNPTDPALKHMNGATVKGDLFANGALPGTVWIAPWRQYSAPTAKVIADANASYAYRAIHETFHLARQGGYSDEQMARAAYSLANRVPPTYSPNEIFMWSGRFDDFLGLHCPKA